MHPVRELVLLGAQCIGEGIHAVELAQQSFEFGSITQRDHCAQISSLPGDRHAVDGQDVLVGDHEGVGPVERPGQQIGKSSAAAFPRNSALCASSISPTNSTSVPSMSGFMRCVK